MIKPVLDPKVLNAEMVPQAILNLPMPIFVKRYENYVQEGHDDLDWFTGVYFVLDGCLPFAILHHAGYPTETTELCLDERIDDVDEISDLVGRILRGFDLKADVVRWQRRDDPDL